MSSGIPSNIKSFYETIHSLDKETLQKRISSRLTQAEREVVQQTLLQASLPQTSSLAGIATKLTTATPCSLGLLDQISKLFHRIIGDFISSAQLTDTIEKNDIDPLHRYSSYFKKNSAALQEAATKRTQLFKLITSLQRAQDSKKDSLQQQITQLAASFSGLSPTERAALQTLLNAVRTNPEDLSIDSLCRQFTLPRRNSYKQQLPYCDLLSALFQKIETLQPTSSETEKQEIQTLLGDSSGYLKPKEKDSLENLAKPENLQNPDRTRQIQEVRDTILRRVLSEEIERMGALPSQRRTKTQQALDEEFLETYQFPSSL